MEGAAQTFLSRWWPEVAPWLVYLVIPFSAAIIGWLTNMLAIRMTFYPIHFAGWRLSKRHTWLRLGWQGIIPLKAEKMAATSADLMLEHLIDVHEIFEQLDPERVAEELEVNIRNLARNTLDEAMLLHAPLIWHALGQRRRNRIIEYGMRELPAAVGSIMEDVRKEIIDLWDPKVMVLEEIEHNRGVMNELFLRCGEEEFHFLEKSGLYFGFLFGLAQMVGWHFVQAHPWAWVTLPAAGLLVGYLTNAIALKLIFGPKRPIRMGPITLHGMLLRRQKDVSGEFGKVLARRFFTIPNIFDNILHGKATGRIVDMVERQVSEVIDKTAGFNRSFIRMSSGTQAYRNIKRMCVDRFREEMPRCVEEAFDYAEYALDIQHTVAQKMSALPPEEFLGFMRPAFKEDEWKLILIGALLGMVAGFVQVLFLI